MARRKPEADPVLEDNDPEIGDNDPDFDESDEEGEDAEEGEDEEGASDFVGADNTDAPADIDTAQLTPEQRAAVYLIGPGGARPSRFKVNNGDPAFDYFHFIASELREDEAERLRSDLFNRGFEPANGPWTNDGDCREFVPAAPGAEIWKVKKSISKRYKRDRLEKALSSPEFLQAQAGRTQRNAILNATLADARKARKEVPAMQREPTRPSVKRALFGNRKGAQRINDVAQGLRERVQAAHRGEPVKIVNR